jgi:hypothetical protein
MNHRLFEIYVRTNVLTIVSMKTGTTVKSDVTQNSLVCVLRRVGGTYYLYLQFRNINWACKQGHSKHNRKSPRCSTFSFPSYCDSARSTNLKNCLEKQSSFLCILCFTCKKWRHYWRQFWLDIYHKGCRTNIILFRICLTKHNPNSAWHSNRNSSVFWMTETKDKPFGEQERSEKISTSLGSISILA